MIQTYRLAKSIVTTLVHAGETAYFAGGWVRDYLLGHPSEDIDIATSASPEKIRSLFPQTILVGLAFGIVIVVIDGHQFEVATFRKDLNYIDGRRPESIEISTAPEDALRRDFTINGMFYDPLKDVVHDYVQGKQDLQHRIIRAIGDPYERFFEDRLRMLRAFRFSARFEFAIDPETEEAIRQHADTLLPAVAMERVWQEFTKMASYPRFDQAVVEMHRVKLLDQIFPEISQVHLNDVRDLVSHYAHFPLNTPPILYLMELFPHLNIAQKLEICQRLRISNKDLALIEFYEKVNQTIQQKIEDKVIWAHFYAHKECSMILQVISARLEDEKRACFLKSHKEQQNSLHIHIQRIKEGKPLINSLFLNQHGITQGKRMGCLLKRAEMIAITQDLNDKEQILAQLKQHAAWTIL